MFIILATVLKFLVDNIMKKNDQKNYPNFDNCRWRFLRRWISAFRSEDSYNPCCCRTELVDQSGNRSGQCSSEQILQTRIRQRTCEIIGMAWIAEKCTYVRRDSKATVIGLAWKDEKCTHVRSNSKATFIGPT